MQKVTLNPPLTLNRFKLDPPTIPRGIPSHELVPTVFHMLTNGRVARRVRVLLTHGSGDRVVFDTTRDTSRDGVGTWSRAWTRDRLGTRVSRDIDFPGSRGRGCTFSTWL